MQALFPVLTECSGHDGLNRIGDKFVAKQEESVLCANITVWEQRGRKDSLFTFLFELSLGI